MNLKSLQPVAETYLAMPHLESAEAKEPALVTEDSSNPVHHDAEGVTHDYANHMKAKFGVRTTFHGSNKLKFHGPVHKIRQALEYHYGNFDDAARKHKHLYPASYLRKSL